MQKLDSKNLDAILDALLQEIFRVFVRFEFLVNLLKISFCCSSLLDIISATEEVLTNQALEGFTILSCTF